MGTEFVETLIPNQETLDDFVYSVKTLQNTSDMDMYDHSDKPTPGDEKDQERLGSNFADEEEVWLFLTNLESSPSAARTDDVLPESSADDAQVVSRDMDHTSNGHLDQTPIESSSYESPFDGQDRPSRSSQVGDEPADAAEAASEEDRTPVPSEDAIASAANDTPSLLEPFQPSTSDQEHSDHAPHSAPDSSLTDVPESEFSTSPLVPHSHSQSLVPNDSGVPAPQPSPLPSHSDSFTMPIPKCLWCGTERQADTDCCEWSILKGSSNQRGSSLRRISSEWTPRLAWDESREGGGGSLANLKKSVSTLSMANFAGTNFGLKKDGPMAALQRILCGKF